MAKQRIMVIDDEENFLLLIKRNLEETGSYEVLTLSGAKDIIKNLHSFQPNLILLDILMPESGGLEACETLNNDSLGQSVPVIVLSALEKDADKLKAYKLGVVDYLTKPIDTQVLIGKIEKALRFKR